MACCSVRTRLQDGARKLPKHWVKAMEAMSAGALAAYRACVHDDPEFLTFWRQATPIDEIGELNFGSRPTYRRKGSVSVADLRAIPWVFSWMQSRFNFPGWYMDSAPGFQRDPPARTGRREALARDVSGNGRSSRPPSPTPSLRCARRTCPSPRSTLSLVEDEGIRERVALAHPRLEFRLAEKAVLVATGQRELLENEPVLARSDQAAQPLRRPAELPAGGDDQAAAAAEKLKKPPSSTPHTR